jgi:hypothetical protein
VHNCPEARSHAVPWYCLIKLILRNILRHRLRSGLTATGIVVAIITFGMLRTLVDAWYAGAEATSATRLVTRNAISLVFPLPISYLNRIRQVGSVTAISYANWFGGVYISEKNLLWRRADGQFSQCPRLGHWFHLIPNESGELI